MLLGVMSDSHENMPKIQRAVAYFNEEKVDAVIHGGDIISPICAMHLKKLKVPFYAVFGNNDGEHEMWQQKIDGWGEIHVPPMLKNVNGNAIAMLHEPYELETFVEQQAYDMIVYGHTHQIDVRLEGRTRIINPGECGGWMTGRSTIALVRFPDKECIIVDL